MGTPQAFAGKQGVVMTQRIIPYLTVKGAADAIAFYTKAFGAIWDIMMRPRHRSD